MKLFKKSRLVLPHGILLLMSLGVQAQFQPETIGEVATLPEAYPDRWIMVHDASFFHMFEGEVLVIDPLGTTIGDQYKGMMTASFIASYRYGAKRNEHYVVETFYTRGARGGERTDLVAVYDPTTLTVSAEIEIPAKRLSGMPKDLATGFIGDERFLGIYNFTPGQSVSIIDLESRAFVTEVPTPGCAFVVPNGKHSFTSICSNGTLLTRHLRPNGELRDTSKSEVLFDPENDPIFEAAAMANGEAHFPTFSGRVLPLDVSKDDVTMGAAWWLTGANERAWRPGGLRPVIADSAGSGYFLMNPEGGEGTHKDGGSEVWIYDLQARSRVQRVVLKNWGVAVGVGGSGDERLLFVTNAEMGIDVYNAIEGSYVKTLNTGAQTPFFVHGR